MAGKKYKPKVVTIVCNNCLRHTKGIRDENGLLKYQCTYCGSMTVSRVISRRHVQIDVYAPQNEELDED